MNILQATTNIDPFFYDPSDADLTLPYEVAPIVFDSDYISQHLAYETAVPVSSEAHAVDCFLSSLPFEELSGSPERLREGTCCQ